MCLFWPANFDPFYFNEIRKRFDEFSSENSPTESLHNEFSDLSMAIDKIASKQINWKR